MYTSEDLYADEFEEDENEDEGNASEAEEVPITDNNDNQEDESAKKTVKPKRVIRNPQPKLNPDTLKGKRGLMALPSYFDRVTYKGKGHEEQDLTVILKTYEYWCHRLFPKHPFEQCISKIEKLGTKRVVATHIKKIRLDMVQDDEPIINDVDSDVEENVIDDFDDFNNIFYDIPNVQTQISITEEQQEKIRLNREKAEKIRQEKLKKAHERSQSALGDTTNYLNENFSQVSIESFNEDTQSLLLQSETCNTTVQIELNEEQQELIKLNKERAERIRQEVEATKDISQVSTWSELTISNENCNEVPSQSSENVINSCAGTYKDFGSGDNSNDTENSFDVAKISNIVKESIK